MSAVTRVAYPDSEARAVMIGGARSAGDALPNRSIQAGPLLYRGIVFGLTFELLAGLMLWWLFTVIR
jgi:hypothetical protein